MDEDYQETKMDPQHEMYLRRMLNEKKLPELVLELYHRVKLMTDRIDGRVSVSTLALIAVMAGVPEKHQPELAQPKGYIDPNEADEQQSTEQGSALQADKEVEKILEPSVEVPAMTGEQAAEAVASGDAIPIGTPPDNKKVELSETPVVDGEQATADVPETDESKPDLPAYDSVESPVKQPDEGKAMLWAHGMPVKVLDDDELKQGKIVGILHPVAGSKKPTQLTVEYGGGETVTVDENEVEAI